MAAPLWKFKPETVSRTPALPACAVEGFSDVICGAGAGLTAKEAGAEACVSELTTVMDAFVCAAIRPGATVAVSCVVETQVVGRLVLFHRTEALETKPVPLTVSVKPGPPACAEDGLSELICGGGALIAKLDAAEVCPSGLATVTLAEPDAAT